MRKLLEYFIASIFFVILKMQGLFLKAIFLFKPKSNYLLKKYLIFDHRTRQQIIARASEGLFAGLHPKNVFNYRYEFFFDNVGQQDIVLDLGCGTGVILSKISGKIEKGIGIDYSQESVDLCNKMHSRNNLKFIRGDILSFDFARLKKDENYTVAIYSHILEHIKDVPSFLRIVDAKRIIICVPSQENWLSQLKIHLKLPYFIDLSHFREYTRENLKDEVNQAGYKVRSMGFNAEGEIVCLAEK